MENSGEFIRLSYAIATPRRAACYRIDIHKRGARTHFCAQSRCSEVHVAVHRGTKFFVTVRQKLGFCGFVNTLAFKPAAALVFAFIKSSHRYLGHPFAARHCRAGYYVVYDSEKSHKRMRRQHRIKEKRYVAHVAVTFYAHCELGAVLRVSVGKAVY